MKYYKNRSSETILSAKSISKSFGTGQSRTRVLNAVSLEVTRGEFISIMGPSGAGKSTLIHTLGGLEMPDEGEVLISGEKLYDLEGDALTLFRRSHLGYIFQFFALIDELTVRENIELPAVLAGSRVRERSTRLIELVGLSGKESLLPAELSGGEQQACALGRALILEADILLADEPTGNLDFSRSQQVLRMLKRAQADTGKTIILVTHDHDVALVADRLIYLRDGQLEGQVLLREIPSLQARFSRLETFLGSLKSASDAEP